MKIEVVELIQLSLDRAMSEAPKEYVPAYEWFLEHENSAPMVRPTSGSGLADNLPIKIVAGRRGIHKPGGDFEYALSVVSMGNDSYSDGIIDQDDGTWILNYCEQEKAAESKKMDDVYNRALRKSMKAGFPVGVFVQVSTSPSLYKCKGLAFVESYEDGIFTLHGPVNRQQTKNYWSIISGENMSQEAKEIIQDWGEEDERVYKAVMQAQRERQDRFRSSLLNAYDRKCAISSYDVVPALQAAHITSFRGPKSQHVTNGLLLRADLHLLYDAYLLSIDPEDYRVRIAPEIIHSQYSEINGVKIRVPALDAECPSERRLAVHFEKFRLKRGV